LGSDRERRGVGNLRVGKVAGGVALVTLRRGEKRLAR